MKRRKEPTVFVVPAFMIYTLLLVVPILLAIFFSFNKWNGITEMEFVGLKNYIDLLQDKRLHDAVANTVIIAVSVVVGVNVFGLGAAILVKQPCARNKVFRTIIFIPFVLSSVAIAFVWKSIFSYNGVLNSILTALGHVDWIGNWMGKKGGAMVCIILVEIWRMLGYHMMIYLAALQTVPAELYESCIVDGGNAWHKLRHVTLPMILPASSVSILMSIINELRIYDTVKIMTDGGPGYDTETIVYNIVVQGFSNNMVGYASAIAVALFLVLGFFTAIIMTYSRKKEVQM